MTKDRALAPGARIGIIGGGQLGRMLALAAARLGLSCHIFSPGEGEPAFEVAAKSTIAPYDDEPALARFAASVDVITYEFENIPAATAEFLQKLKPVRPSPRVLALTQDRLVEKDFISKLGIGVAPYAQVDDAGALARAVGRIGRPSILKTRRFGYDGKGQTTIKEGADLAVAFRSLGNQPSHPRRFCPLRHGSLGGGGARSRRRIFGLGRRRKRPRQPHPRHDDGARAHVARPAPPRGGKGAKNRGSPRLRRRPRGRDVSGRPATLVVNEIAPRVHNSGHWTLDGSVTSQFEQHIRAVCGFPLGSTRAHGPVVMRNLIGDDINDWRELLRQPGACLHLYGKSEARPGRKMGHVTFLKA